MVTVPGLDLGRMAARLADVRGVVGVTLGGSRARGDAHPASWSDCLAGRVTSYAQPGHPHGVWSPAYAALTARARWEAGFSLDVAAKAAARGDVARVAGCAYRAVGCLVQAIHADARRWLVNEKGGVAAAAALPGTPPDFAGRVAALLGRLGTTPAELAVSLAAARRLVAQPAQNGGHGTAGQSPDGSG